MKAHLFLAAAAGALTLAACGDADEPAADATATGDAMAEQTTAPTATDTATATTAQAFVDTASASDLYEIEAGKLAQQMGKSQEVKDFGAMMVKDHTKSSADLKTAAASATGVTVNPQLTPMQQSNLDALKDAGDNFDTVYAQQQVAAHEMALQLLKDYASGGDTPSLKDFASKTAPVVETHLGHARDLP